MRLAITLKESRTQKRNVWMEGWATAIGALGGKMVVEGRLEASCEQAGDRTGYEGKQGRFHNDPGALLSDIKKC